MIKKFKQFEDLKSNFKYTINEDLSESGIIKELKDLSDNFDKSQIDGFIGSIGDVTYTIKINFNRPSYHSSVPTGQILESVIKNIPLSFILNIDVPNTFDRDYLISIIIHEIRHIYDIYTTVKKKHLYSFTRDIKINLIRNEINDIRFSKFLNCVYYSLLHELVARNNQVYPIIKNKKLSKEDSYKMIKNTFIYSSFEYLKSFDSNKFINEFSIDELVKFTNIFNNLYCSVNREIKNINDYYKKWEIFFKKSQKRWYNEMKLEIDKIYETTQSEHTIVENECDLLLRWIIENFINKSK